MRHNATILFLIFLLGGMAPKGWTLQMPNTDDTPVRMNPPVANVQIKPGCRDSDGGENFTVAGSAGNTLITSGHLNLLLDSCSNKPSGNYANLLGAISFSEQHQSFWQRLMNFFRLPSTPPQLVPPSPGIHDGSFATLKEAVCKDGQPAYVEHDCATEKKSCVEGICKTVSSCTTDVASNTVRYHGLSFDRFGLLHEGGDISRTAAACSDDTTKVYNVCSVVPNGKYEVMSFDGKTYLANQTEASLEGGSQTCHGCRTLYDFDYLVGHIHIEVCGCVDKQKLLSAIGDIPGTGDIQRDIRNNPDFAYCAHEDPPPDFVNHAGGQNADSGNSGGGNSGGTTVTTACVPLSGNEPNNPCQPTDNGVKIVDSRGNIVDIRCNRCDPDDPNGQFMFQATCLAAGGQSVVISGERDCGASKCSPAIGRCSGCQNPGTGWCGSAVP